MTAARLRQAAALMRERAKAADPSPWDAEEPDVVGSGESWVVYAANGEHERSIPHIASWHPAVALAVADWLDAQADEIGDLAPRLTWERVDDSALAVADAYLGT